MLYVGVIFWTPSILCAYSSAAVG